MGLRMKKGQLKGEAAAWRSDPPFGSGESLPSSPSLPSLEPWDLGETERPSEVPLKGLLKPLPKLNPAVDRLEF